jgi:XTP/dITP diphosphohydrolase
MKLCFATNNRNKLAEVSEMLGDSFNLVSLKEIGCETEIPEDHETLQENSQQKAEFIVKKYQMDAFADDTGLEVEALGGAPGVYSARYAGPQKNNQENIRLLLQNLSNKPNRKAQFRTIITLILNQQVHQFEGKVKGEIITELRGAEGFGYDPIFVPTGYSKTFAEMNMQEKSLISHRGQAVAKLVAFLKRS